MKSILLFCLLLSVVETTSRAQTADDYVTQGRGYLAATNIMAANNSFSNAVAVSPTNQTANVFYAATRLLVLPSQPVGSNFLTRLGVAAAGRNIYHWAARPPKDTNGALLAPAGVDANEASSLLRTNILSVLVAADLNLAAITDTNFSLSLTSGETRTVAVTVDYGDVQMFRAMIQAAEYFIFTTYSWNLDAQLTVIRSLDTNNKFSIDGLLGDYPQLLTFGTTNDLGAAQNAFVNGVNRYLVASQIIRDRPSGTIRLFNYDERNAKGEGRFRLTISDLASSLTNGVVTLQANSNYSVFLPSHFSGAHTFRSFLPRFLGRGFVLGTVPDTTFGGLIQGVGKYDIDQILAKRLTPIPDILSAFASSMQTPQFLISGLKGHGYVIQISTDLANWSDYAAFASLGGAYAFSDPAGFNQPHQFYRVVDRTANMPLPSNDNFANRIPLTGLEIQTTGYGGNATAEVGEPGFGQPSVWWSWTAPSSGLVVVSTTGSPDYPGVNVYTGTTLAGLTTVSNLNGTGNYYFDGYAFNASAGTTYQIQVLGYAFGRLGAIRLEIGVPPVLNVFSPTNNAVLTAPANITISASASSAVGHSASLTFYTNSVLLAHTTNSSLSITLTNLPSGSYFVQEQVSDDLGLSTSASQTVTIQPANDNFVNSIALPAVPGTTIGSNAGASKEPGEPNHAGDAGGSSVWWSWTAQTNEFVNISAGLTTIYGYPATTLLGVYTGNSVSNLTVVTSASGTTAQAGFFAAAGVNYKIAVDAQSGAPGSIVLRLWTPFTVNISSPTNGAVLYGPANITLAADVTTPAAGIAAVNFYNYYNNALIGTVTNAPYSLNWSNVNVGLYSVVAQAVDNQHNVSVSAPTSFTVEYPETSLTLNVPMVNLSGPIDAQTFYKVTVPSGKFSLTISISGGTGDCDLYVAYGYQPDLVTYDYAPFLPGNNETVTVTYPPAGDWHIMLNGFNAYSGVTLIAK